MVEQFTLIIYLVQIVHSIEELSTGFHRKWYLFKMPFWIFLTFEILHNLFWGIVILNKDFPYRIDLLYFFIYLMLANGLQHIIWFAVKKKYVPGLITAPIHIILFILFYIKL